MFNNRGPIVFGVALVLVIAAIGAWIYFLAPPQGLAVGLALTADPATPFVGDPFDMSVALTNNSAQVMRSATLTINLPAGIVAADTGRQFVTQLLGDVSAGGVSHQDFQLVAMGGENTVAHLVAKVAYGIDGSSQQFTATQDVDVPVGQSAVDASLSAPASIFSGQNFQFTVNYHNNTDHPVSGMTLAMQYPTSSFSFIGASSSLATNGDNSWSLGTIPANGAGAVTITGNLIGPNETSYPIGAAIVESVGGATYTITNPSAVIALAASPLAFSIAVNGSQSYVSKTGDSLDYIVSFTNNAPVAFQNIVISAKLVGAMFDFSSLSTNGAFNSVADVITWNGDASPQLLSLAPGQSGTVEFRIRTKNAFPITSLASKNYSLAVNATLQSPTVPPGTVASSTISVTSMMTKLGGAIALTEKAYHREPTASITNSGPYPPIVNKATQYTIHWLVTNYATDANNVTISAYLQSGVTCTGAEQVPASTTFACNPSSGQVTWQIPIVPATTGIADKPLEAVFQLTSTAAVNQVGQTPTLLGASTLTATDGFTGAAMQSSAGPVTTAVPDDTSVSVNNRGVQE